MKADFLDEVRRKFSRDGVAGKWHALYEAETERLDEFNYRLRRDAAVEMVMARLPANGRVLDLGCGAAPVLAELRQRGTHVTGMDASPDMLDFARQRLRELGLDPGGLLVGDCRDTGLPTAGFDVVVCLGVISYIPDYEAALREISRLLKPGGLLVLSFRNAWRPVFSDPLLLARRAVRTLLRPVLGPSKPEAFALGRLMDHREVLCEVEALGFRREDFRGIGFGPFCIGGRPLFGHRNSILISQRLARGFDLLHLRWPQRWLADVSLWVYRKPGAPT